MWWSLCVSIYVNIILQKNSLKEKTYNPEQYELVEKKDYKIKKLKESIEASNRQKHNNNVLIDQVYVDIGKYRMNIKVCDEDIKKLEQELKELEK